MTDTNSNYNTKWIAKYQQIEDCLRGDDDTNMIDLWQLRELSLSYGGLLDPKLRKRAWPILTQAMIMNATMNTSTTDSSSSSVQQHVSIQSKDLLQIQKDVKRTVWNVKAHFRSQQKQQTEASLQQAPKNDNATRRVKFFVVDNNERNQHPDTDRVETSTSHSNEDENGNSKLDPNYIDDFLYDDTTSIMSSSFAGTTNSRRSTTSSKHSRSTKASKHEQRTVTNVIASCLRTIPSVSSTSERATAPTDNRLHYYTGFHDLTALIMVNVESLSISALLLTKLAVYHLRDALRKDRVVLDTAMKLIFFPLLKSIDDDLFQHLVGQGIDDIKKLFSFIIYVISNWFATDIIDIASASRLIDVFVVSHPTTPIYSTIAILVYYRETILSSSDMNRTVRTLPIFKLASGEDGPSAGASLAIVEEIIALTLKYMKHYRPGALMKLNESAAIWSDETRTQLLENVSSISMLTGTPPTWCISDMSPNEWTIIQNAIRGTNSDGNIVINSLCGRSMAKHPLAIVALDVEIPLTQSKGNVTSVRRYALVPIIVVITIILVQFGTFLFSGNVSIFDNRAIAERGTSNVPDSVTSCLDAQLLESSAVGIAPDISDINTEKRPGLQANESAAFSDMFSAEEKEDETQEMMVPSNTPFAYGDIEDDSPQHMSSITENVEIKNVEETIKSTARTILTKDCATDPSTDIELVFEQNVLEFIQFRALMVERRLRALRASSKIEHVRQILKSRMEKMTSVRNILADDILTDPLSDAEIAFEQNILNLVQQRSLIMERRLQAFVTSPKLHHVQRVFAAQIVKLISKLQSQVLQCANVVRASPHFSQAVAAISIHGNIYKDRLHNLTEKLHNELARVTMKDAAPKI